MSKFNALLPKRKPDFIVDDWQYWIPERMSNNRNIDQLPLRLAYIDEEIYWRGENNVEPWYRDGSSAQEAYKHYLLEKALLD